LPPPVIHEAKRRFIDSFATAVGAMDAEAYKIARCSAERVNGKPSASLLEGGKSSPNGRLRQRLAHRYLDYNDTYLSLEPAHPSDNLAVRHIDRSRASQAGRVAQRHWIS